MQINLVKQRAIPSSQPKLTHKFKDKTQNKYFNNRNALPVRGFPTFVYHWGMDNKYSHINLVECDLDDNDEDDEGYVEKPYEYSYENDRIYEKRKKMTN